MLLLCASIYILFLLLIRFLGAFLRANIVVISNIPSCELRLDMVWVASWKVPLMIPRNIS